MRIDYHQTDEVDSSFRPQSFTIISVMFMSRLGTLLIFALLAGCAAPIKKEQTESSPQKFSPEVAVKEPRTSSAPEKAVADPSELDKQVVDRLKSACVLIGNFETGELISTGSGFITDGGKTVITNKHVVTGTDDKVDSLKLVINPGMENSKLLVIEPENVAVIEDIGRDSEKYRQIDVAAIRLPSAEDTYVAIAAEPDLAETKAVWSFGFPLGTEIMKSGKNLPTPTVHSMRIERVERLKQKVKVLQLSGSPTNGSSGGPVVSRDGTVLAVLSAVQGDQQKIIYAVPLYAVRDVIAKVNSQEMVAQAFDKPLKSFSDTIEGKSPASKSSSSRPSDPGPRTAGTSALHGFYVSDEVLSGLTARELTILRNEPFARRGYRFSRAILRQHFSQFSWYEPRTSNTSAIERSFSKTERYNINFIRQFQSKYGMTW